MLNPKLKKGDRIILLHMEDETIEPGLKGIVYNVTPDPFDKGEIIYGVQWENGRTLNILSGVDGWKKIEKKEKMNENKDTLEWAKEAKELKKYFQTNFLVKYLIKLRDTGIVNMYGASPYLYMGKERIAHEFYYNPPAREEEFEELLDMANEAQSIMISGVMAYLEDKGKGLEVNTINAYLQRFATKIVGYYINVFQ